MKTILLVDDDDAVRGMLQVLLTGLGYVVHEARDGKEGALIYRAQRPDVVITDILMPERDGLELIMEIRRSNRNTKIIVISGGGHGSAGTYLDTAQKLGANFTLEKPFATEDLLSMIRLATGTETGPSSPETDLTEDH